MLEAHAPMKRRFTLVAFALVLLALLALPVGTHLRAKWRAEAYRRELSAGGEPATLSALQPVLSPEEIRTGAELVAAAGRFRQPFSNAPTMKLLAPGRALAACREKSLPTDESTNVWPGLEFLLAKNQDALDQVRTALAGPAGFGFSLDYSVGPSLLLPHLAKMKAAVQWLSLSAAVELHAGDMTNAFEDLYAFTKMVSGYGKEHLMISELVRIAMAAIAVTATWEALQCPGWNDRQLQLLHEEWQKLDLLTQAEAVLQVERLSLARTFEAGRGSFNAINFQPGGGNSGLNELAHVGKELVDNPSEGVKSALHRYPRYWGWKYWQSYEDEIANGKILQAAIDAVRQARGAGIPGLAVTRFTTSAARVSAAYPAAFKWLGDAFSGLGSGYSPAESTERFLMRIRTVEIERALLITAIGLKRYELKHGRYPENLNALSPEFAAQVPSDPMDGKPLRYRLNADGTFLLYSVGENGLDNGGNGEPLKEFPRQWWRARDAVWPWPASAEQVQAEFRRAQAEYAKRVKQESRNPATASLMEQFRKRYGLEPTAATNRTGK